MTQVFAGALIGLGSSPEFLGVCADCARWPTLCCKAGMRTTTPFSTSLLIACLSAMVSLACAAPSADDDVSAGQEALSGNQSGRARAVAVVGVSVVQRYGCNAGQRGVGVKFRAEREDGSRETYTADQYGTARVHLPEGSTFTLVVPGFENALMFDARSPAAICNRCFKPLGPLVANANGSDIWLVLTDAVPSGADVGSCQQMVQIGGDYASVCTSAELEKAASRCPASGPW